MLSRLRSQFRQILRTTWPLRILLITPLLDEQPTTGGLSGTVADSTGAFVSETTPPAPATSVPRNKPTHNLLMTTSYTARRFHWTAADGTSWRLSGTPTNAECTGVSLYLAAQAQRT